MGLNETDVRRVIWTFAQAFLGTLLVLAPGVLQAPNLTTAKALGISAIVASAAAGISALKNLLLDDGSSLK